VIGDEAALDRQFNSLEDRGVKVIRWYLFPGDAWQIARGSGNAPLRVRAGALRDMDRAARLAKQHDLYIVWVLFSDTRTIPSTWMTDPAQREQLADALQPMFHRYGRNRHVLAWDLFNEPERGIDSTAVPQADVQSTVARLAHAVHVAGSTRATVSSVGVDRVSLWKGLGLNYLSASWFTSHNSGPSCARCQTRDALETTYDLNVPLVISATNGHSTSTTLANERWFYAHGYAGLISWSLYKREHPANPGVRVTASTSAPWHLMYDSGKHNVGPRARVLNPCLGPRAHATLMCPDIRMGRPSNIFLGHRGRKTVLYSSSSLNSVGRGPAEIHGRRNGHYTMRAVQRIHRRHSRRRIVIHTGAKLYFKAIPGQYRYWKWNGAARMELWRLNGKGRPLTRVRRGPKTIYCLRDLKRTRPGLPRSPHGRVYPGCNQSLGTRQVTLGTSVGWSDIYPSTYYQNWIDVTHLRGCFAYVHIADPTNVVYESNEHNNRTWVTVRLPYTGSNRGCPHARFAPTKAGDGGLY
jgi:hypothetical protein